MSEPNSTAAAALLESCLQIQAEMNEFLAIADKLAYKGQPIARVNKLTEREGAASPAGRAVKSQTGAEEDASAGAAPSSNVLLETVNSARKPARAPAAVASSADVQMTLEKHTWSGAPSRRPPELGRFGKAVRGEIRVLQKIIERKEAAKDGPGEQEPPAPSKKRGGPREVLVEPEASWSNQPYLEAVWAVAKRIPNILHMPRETSVDIVADDGLLWVKVSTLTNRRMMMDLLTAGWGGFDPDGEPADEPALSDKDDELGQFEPCVIDAHGNVVEADQPAAAASTRVPPIGLVKAVTEMCREARDVHIRGFHPRISVVLPRIYPKQSPPVAAAIRALAELGKASEPYIDVSVETADERERMSEHEKNPAATRERLLGMMPSPIIKSEMTETMNVDCSILLAISSDVSHEEPDVSEQAGTAKAKAILRRQIEIERNMQLVPQILWPAMSGRKLICTADSASKFFEIVNEMGTPTEQERARLMFGRNGRTEVEAGSPVGPSPDSLNALFQDLTRHSVPPPGSWQLPIMIVPREEEKAAVEKLEEKYQQVLADMDGKLVFPNRSVFLYGWAAEIVTITSNQAAVGILHEALERRLKREVPTRKSAGQSQSAYEPDLRRAWLPSVWISATARSLLAKEKARRDAGPEIEEQLVSVS